MADKRISQLVERINIANNDVLPIVASGATTTNKVTVSTLQDWMQDNLDVGVTSVGLSMPSAFTVTNSPVTTSGNISVVGAGTVSQYIRGDGSLADFPQGGGGGGASVSYYLNGSVSQGTIGGIAYREMNKTPILGTGTDFTISSNGYIASFITDAGDPALLEIPAGNWNFETYLQASSGGGSPTFYIELYKVNSGGTATLIASNSGTPELIAFGTTITPYFSALAVPTTSLTITDRLALRYYVTPAGRTITMHTENSHLCQVITTFTTGLTALNGLTAQVQNFATGTSGTDFGISSASTTHTFNLPTASATNRGALSSVDWSTFNGKQAALNGTGFVKISGTTISYDNSTYLTTGTAASTYVPYSGATGSVNLGSNNISSNLVTANGSGSTAGQINLRSDAVFALVNGYGSIASGTTNQFNLYQTTGAGVFRGAILSLNSISESFTRVYTLPDANGTLALTSDIPSLTGYVTIATAQTITGLKTFSTSSVEMAIFNSTFATGGVLAFSRNGVNVGNIGNSGSLTVGILDDLEIRSGSAKKIHLRTDATQFTLSPSGGATLFSADGTTPTLVLNTPTSLQASGLVTQHNGSNRWAFGTNFGSGDDSWNVYNYAAATRFLTITSGGNLGIRTPTIGYDGAGYGAVRYVTVNNTSGTGSNLELATGTTANDGYIGAVDFINTSNTGASGAGRYGIASIRGFTTNSSATNTGGGYLTFNTKADGGSGAERMRIFSNGDVRINFNTGAPNGLYFSDTTNSAAMLYIIPSIYVGSAPYNSNRIVSANNSNLSFECGGAERMKVTSGGSVIVGASYMTYPVSIEAQSGGGQLALTRSGAVAEFYMGGTTGGSTVLYVRSGGSGGVYLAAGSTGWVANSDERLKTDLVPIENGLEKVASLRSVIGRYLTDDEDKKRAFLIAQDVEKVLPEAVVTIEETGDMGVNYTEVIPLLVAAIKELKIEIDSLKNQIK